MHLYLLSPLLCLPCLHFSALLMLSFYVFPLSLLHFLHRVSCSLLGHNRNPHHSHTTLFSHIIRAWVLAWAWITFMWLFPFTTIWCGRRNTHTHTLCWTHAKCSAWPECLVAGITKTCQRTAVSCPFTLEEMGLCHVLLSFVFFVVVFSMDRCCYSSLPNALCFVNTGEVIIENNIALHFQIVHKVTVSS